MKTVNGDKAFCYKHEGDKLVGIVITCVDDLSIASDKKFIIRIEKTIKDNLTVSKVEKDGYRFTSIDVKKNRKSNSSKFGRLCG